MTITCQFSLLATTLWPSLPHLVVNIICSDGLWDKVSNQEAVDIARPFCVEKHPNLIPLAGGPMADERRDSIKRVDSQTSEDGPFRR